MSQLHRIAMLSVHTSPLATPGSGDAGGMNVYVAETARRIARRGIEVDIFTRATSGRIPVCAPLDDGVTVRHVTAGPFEGLGKLDLPGQLCAFTAGVMRAEAMAPEGHYDLIHSHYWLSGQVGWLAAERWQVPLVHTMHTMAKVKNRSLAQGDSPEPPGREIGEEQVVAVADELVANTETERRELVELYDADPARVAVVPPGVDLETFHPAPQPGARARLRALGQDLPDDAVLLLFVGRIQPLKAPDVLVRAAAELLRRRPELRPRLRVAILGGDSAGGYGDPDHLRRLAGDLGVADRMIWHHQATRQELADWFRAADVVTVPSHNESFGLVAIEALACGAPLAATRVGGLPTAVGDAGLLVPGHEPAAWADAVAALLDHPDLPGVRARAAAHARGFSWERSVDRLLEVYADAVGSHQRRTLAS
ncbi:D-inositol-3-phosphate glycosyltransferase [Arsenicicoccus dermatophilus]|uniref:D-inositol-3-phosphate glycosyltransferase n=1 Tax=Arsenicicoccus dermatophilus TaxID=1076331 RepID=UPI001F4D1577|nr:D-inositol-3-phosphate glycosyltransferase [Arsenicicoccus dermatophilus]MCH8611986.1 D-inositol-3-phosphate glycosyltransferase [Arsenicicoccus dermatophilus]